MYRNGTPDRREVLTTGPDPLRPNLAVLRIGFADESSAKGDLNVAALGEPALPLDSVYAQCRDHLPPDTLGSNRFRLDGNWILKECGSVPEGSWEGFPAQVSITEMQWGALQVDAPRPPSPWAVVFR